MGIPLLGAMGWLFYHHWIGCIGALIFSVPALRIYEALRLYDQRRRAYQELRDVLYLLSSTFAAGGGLKEGMEECGRILSVSYGEQSLLIREIDSVRRAIEEGNASEAWLLDQMAERSGLPELKQVAVIYGLCLRTGGDLSNAMIETADAMLRRLQLWQEVDAQTSQKRLEFTVMLVIVPLLLAAVNAASSYLSPLYETAVGRVVMTAALLGWWIAAAWSMAIMEGGRR